MIKIVPERIPLLELKSSGVDDWQIICDGRVIVRNLSEYMARIFAAAPHMLTLLDKMSRREHAPARIPIEVMLRGCGIEFARGSNENGREE